MALRRIAPAQEHPMHASTATIVSGRLTPSLAAAPRAVAERRGEAMRALFPLLYSWRAGRSERALPPRVYAYLAVASTPAELEGRLRRPLRRYPTELIERLQLRDGRSVLVRPLGCADRPLQQAFVRALSPLSRRRRFHTGVTELSEPALRYLTEVDHVDHVALIGEVGAGDGVRQVAEARWVRRQDEADAADFAIAVADDHQGAGLGARLMDRLERSARARGVTRLCGSILRGNTPMVAWLARRGWRFTRDPLDPSVVDAECSLDAGEGGWRQAA
jgi:acetyltransferase